MSKGVQKKKAKKKKKTGVKIDLDDYVPSAKFQPVYLDSIEDEVKKEEAPVIEIKQEL